MKRLAAGLITVILVAVASACSSGSNENSTNPHGIPTPLRVGLIPNVSPEKQQARYEPLAKYLKKELDVPVKLVVASDYAGVVEALASDHIDIAYLGGLTYVQAERQVELTPMVTEIDRHTGTKEYESAIVVQKKSKLRSLEDLADGKASFAFGDISSTSGSLYPRKMLVDSGVKCSSGQLSSCPPLSEVSFTGGHDAVAQAVAAGSADAGGLELRILRRLEREGSIDSGALRVIASHRVMGYPWVARKALGTEATEKISQAFEQMKDPELLELMRASGYEKVSPADYDEVRTEAEKLGLTES